MSVSRYVSKSLLARDDKITETDSAFCHLLKKSAGNPYLKICDLMQYFFVDAPMKKNRKFFVRGGTTLFGHQIQNNLFAISKKSFYKP